MRYFCFGVIGLQGTLRNKEHWVTREALLGKAFSEMKKCVDASEKKNWRLFDIWDRRFDKLPVISAKLSLRVTGADEAEEKKKTDASSISGIGALTNYP
ncbi:hypothetical protein ACFX11_034409 [Malus domestica]